jgi:GR25 family glycosyltransferase involved in LPS biosynthesis
MNIEELFKHSIVISRMPYRLEWMKKSFTVAGLPMPAIHLNALTGKGQYKKTLACKMSHGKAVKYAKDHDWPYVLVFEDDAWPRHNAKEKLEELLKTLPHDDIKIAAIGFSDVKENKEKYGPYNNDWRIMSDLIGAQSYIVFKSAYDAFLNIALKPKIRIKGKDSFADIAIGRYAQRYYGFDTHFWKDNLFIQYNDKKEKSIKQCKRVKWFYGYYYMRRWFKSTKLKPWFWMARKVNKVFNEKYIIENIVDPLTIDAKDV